MSNKKREKECEEKSLFESWLRLCTHVLNLTTRVTTEIHPILGPESFGMASQITYEKGSVLITLWELDNTNVLSSVFVNGYKLESFERRDFEDWPVGLLWCLMRRAQPTMSCVTTGPGPPGHIKESGLSMQERGSKQCPSMASASAPALSSQPDSPQGWTMTPWA